MTGWGGPWSSALRRIQIPADAGPNDARIVITSEPPESLGYNVDAAILFYWNATDYFYIGITNFGDPSAGYLVRGFRSETTGVEDHFEEISYWNDDPAFGIDWETFVGGDEGFTLNLMGNGGYYLSSDGIELNPQSGYWLQGEDAPRTTMAVELPGPSVGGITNTQTVVHTLTRDTSSPMMPDRRYEVRFIGRVRSTVAGDRVAFRIRETNATGTQVRYCGDIRLPDANSDVPVEFACLYEGRQVANETVVLTVVRTAGTGTITYFPGDAWARDIVGTDMT